MELNLLSKTNLYFKGNLYSVKDFQNKCDFKGEYIGIFPVYKEKEVLEKQALLTFPIIEIEKNKKTYFFTFSKNFFIKNSENASDEIKEKLKKVKTTKFLVFSTNLDDFGKQSNIFKVDLKES